MSEIVKLPKNPPSKMGTKEDRLEDCIEAYELRVGNKGMTYKQIGEQLGISESEAWKRCNVVTTFKLKGLITKDEHLKAEINDKLDALFSRWMPLAMSEKIALTEEKVAANGQTYNIELPEWEASHAATKHALDILREKVRINGLAPRDTGRTKIGADAAGEMAAAFFTAMRNLAGNPKQIVEAEVIDGQEGTEA